MLVTFVYIPVDGEDTSECMEAAGKSRQRINLCRTLISQPLKLSCVYNRDDQSGLHILLG